MVVKFFGNKKGGSTASIDYLLNERKSKGTARLLQGDEQLTRDIINSLNFKQKTTVGCLSFEEKSINEDLKYKLMADFENMLLPNMQDRYNILWVEHIDKGRLELNFVIPKIDLESQKSLNPYYHKADLKRVELWQDLTNLENSFTNPKDPSKARTLETNSKELHLSKDYETLDKTLHELVNAGALESRADIIELLQKNNIEVTRTGADYLAIKLPESKKAKRFKGEIYNEQFTSTGELDKVSERKKREVEQFNNRDIKQEIRELRAELNQHTQAKVEYYGKRFKRDNQEKELSTNKHNSHIDSSYNNSFAMDSIRETVQRTDKRNILLHQNERLENDSTGNPTIERIRREQREHKANSRRQQQTGGELLSSFERERESKQGVIKTISDYARELKQVAEKVINKAKGMFRNN
jgi:hypothetical protein